MSNEKVRIKEASYINPGLPDYEEQLERQQVMKMLYRQVKSCL